MTESHQTIHRALDGLVDEPEDHGDWERVLTDAGRATRRSRLVRFAVAALTAVGVAGAAVVASLEDDRPSGIVDLALAAIGDGPVIHVITRGDWGGSLVDLSTGEVTPVHAENEIWLEPGRAARYVSRFGGKVTSDRVMSAAELSREVSTQLLDLADRYREALRTGRAKVVAEGSVEGRPVRWIRLGGEWSPSSEDGRSHLRAEEVAVDATSFEPVYTRWTDDGRPVPGTGQLILKLENLQADEADLSGPRAPRGPVAIGGAALGRTLGRADLARALDGRALWLGSVHDGLPLVESRVQEFRSRTDPDDEWEVVEGVSLFYGSLTKRRAGMRFRDNTKRFVQVLEGTRAATMWRGSELATDVPEGSLLVGAGRTAFLRRQGVLVSVSSPELVDVLAAAAALRPVGDPPASRGLDFERLALLVGRAQRVPTKGFAAVQPRPLVRPDAKPIQRGATRGVTVVVYEGGGARFDTRAMESGLQRALPERLQTRCFRVAGDAVTSGGYGTVPRGAVQQAALLAQPQRGRIPIAKPPFDACELGGGFGRNWLPRYDFHWPLEIGLTARGRSWFENRAAARELAHFVRTGPRRRARKAMRQGAPAPDAARLRDPGRPGIRVRASGDRFTASLTASTGRRFFIEIDGGRVLRSNTKSLARTT
ncbi:MAG TPA: hypothetical protein VFM13_01900 [Gaiellaceae bacterium]|nr:hypothetical protein [Gaiellaceae bacterium]